MFGLYKQYFRASIISDLVFSIIIFIMLILKDQHSEKSETYNQSSKQWRETNLDY